jgi:hypothetical protein
MKISTISYIANNQGNLSLGFFIRKKTGEERGSIMFAEAPFFDVYKNSYKYTKVYTNVNNKVYKYTNKYTYTGGACVRNCNLVHGNVYTLQLCVKCLLVIDLPLEVR